jgi:hypothetical protein
VTNPTVVSGPSPAPSSIAYFGTRQPARPLAHAPRAVPVVKQRERTVRRVHEHWLPRLKRPKGGACSRPRTSVHATPGSDTRPPGRLGSRAREANTAHRHDERPRPPPRRSGAFMVGGVEERGAPGAAYVIDGTSSGRGIRRCRTGRSCDRGLPAVSTRQAVQDMVQGRDAQATSPVPVARAAGPHRPRARPLRSQVRQRARLGRQEAVRASEAASRVGRRRCDGCRSSSSRHGWNARAGSRDAGRGASPTPGDLATEAADA